MNAAQIQRFRERAQSSIETLTPAEISLDDGVTVIACSGGNFSNGERVLDPGGFFDNTGVGFRVTRTLLAAVPQPGKLILCRKVGEVSWRDVLKIDGVKDQVHDVAVSIRCSAVTSPR